MITVQIKGGLGNQLFQYAAARRLAYHHRTQLRLDLSSYAGGTDKRSKGLQAFARNVALFDFCITGAEATAGELAESRDRFIEANPLHRAIRLIRRFQPDFLCRPSHVRERSLAFEPNLLGLPDGSYLDGYWQSWKYFPDIESIIRQEFQPRDQGLVRYAEEYLARIRSRQGAVVSVHVRRGDLAHAVEVLERKSAVQSELVEPAYYQAAMAQFPVGTAFLVFSDSAGDIAWCRSNIRGEGLFFSEGHSDIQDFLLMSRCDHHIIANSTFSWWAAWLNATASRRVLAPRAWFAPGSKYANLQEDLIPQGWEII